MAQLNLGSRGEVYVSAVIPGPIEAVWARASRFADCSWMPITSGSYVEEGISTEENVLGKNRRLVLGNKKIVETLTGYSSLERFYTYAIASKDDGLFPGDFINYKARLSFKPVTESGFTFAEWSAQFDGEESTVKAVEAFIAREVFSRTLTNLKLHFKATHH